MPRATKPSGKSRHDPLYVQLGEDEQVTKYGKVTRPGKRRKSHAGQDDEETGEVWRYHTQATVLHEAAIY